MQRSINLKIALNRNRLTLIFISIAALVLPAIAIPPTYAASNSQKTVSYKILMPNKYQPKGNNGGTDDYRCFLINPKVKENSILTQIKFIPQNEEIVHHAILFRLPAADVSKAKTIDPKNQGWSCFGGSGIGTMFQSFLTSPWLSAWVPGRNTDNAPAGYGYPFNKGDQIVLQVHYNLLQAKKGNVPTDRSTIVLNAVRANGAKVKMLGYELFPAPVELPCPSGTSSKLCDRKQSLMDLAARTSPQSALEVTGIAVMCNQNPFTPEPSLTSTCDRKINRNQLVIAAAPHMHLLGRSLKITVNPDTPNEKILLNRVNYDFDDQSSTVLPKPYEIKAGDTVRVQCTFDPTLRQKLPILRNQPAKYVTWGEGSSDEMCLGVLINSRKITSA